MTERPQRLLRILCCALLLFAIGCASAGNKSARGLDRILQTGEMRIGMSGEQPPLSMTAKDGELLGLDVALARVLAKAMGVEARFVQMPFGQLLGALEDGKVDLVVSGMTITPARSGRVTFVGPYYTSGKSILTRSQELAAVEVPEDLDAQRLRLAALKGSTSEEFARRSLPNARLTLTDGLDDGVQKVLDGSVDALVADRETCSFAVLRHPNAGLIAPPVTFTVEPMGIAIAQQDPRLANLIQTYLTSLSESGALKRAQAFWFRDPSWVQNLR